MTDCRILWPKSSAQAIWQWSAVAGKLGATFPLPRPFLLCIRGVKPGDAEDHEPVHEPRYDDAFVFSAPGEEPVLFAAASHAYQRDSKASPPGPDGRGAVGSIRPGRYMLKDTRNGAEVVFRITQPDGFEQLPAWRDYDHDGKLSPAEMQRSEEARTGAQVGDDGAWASAVLLHGGLDEPNHPDGSAPDHKYSIACFTAPLKYRKLMSEKAKPYDGKIDVVLELATKVVEIVASLPSWDSIAPAPGSVA